MQDSKVFIDTDEEITFIVEKIKQANSKNVVLIVPDRASIFVTSASLRLLRKSIEKLDKKVILVTMDESGKKMAENLGFITAYRVREVTPELWVKTQFAKIKNVPKKTYKEIETIEDNKQESLGETIQKDEITSLHEEYHDENIDESKEPILDESVLNIEEAFKLPHYKANSTSSEEVNIKEKYKSPENDAKVDEYNEDDLNSSKGSFNTIIEDENELTFISGQDIEDFDVKKKV